MSLISVLLVDDSPAFLNVASRFLREQCPDEFVVAGTATRGEEALSQAVQLRPEIVLIDLMMPGLGGLQTIVRLRSLLPFARIIALTLLDEENYRQVARAAGADAFVHKPHLHEDLVPAIRNVVRNGLG